MSLKSDIEKLAETISRFEKLLVRGSLPDHPVIHERDDGSEDEERFKQDFGCTVAEAESRGVVSFLVRTNFRNPNIKTSPLPSRPPLADRPVVIADDDPPQAGEFIPADAPVVIHDLLADSLLRQARDMAARSDKERAKEAEK